MREVRGNGCEEVGAAFAASGIHACAIGLGRTELLVEVDHVELLPGESDK
ncbi:MAG TPA: hypothetical protein VGQ98_03925 [Gemmatimonadaceae bacterium]|nr:hypothetical protein [Gemmatimonadaceae bacterium]